MASSKSVNQQVLSFLVLGFSIGNAFVTAGCSVFGIRSEESPSYQILKVEKDFEIREYEPVIVATTKVKGTYEEAQSEGFKILAGYIFGKNKSKQKIAMTAPVTQSATPIEAPESVKIAMTAPVTQSFDGNEWTMSFTMPGKYRLEDLPTPNDARVIIEKQPKKIYAVLSYTGFWSEKRNEERSSQLRQWLASQEDFKIIGVPSFAGYNPPWTLPFLRKNESWIEVQRSESL